MTTVAIACPTGVYALLFSGLSTCQGIRAAIGIASIQSSNTQGQMHCDEYADDGKRPLGAFHGSAPVSIEKDGKFGAMSQTVIEVQLFYIRR
jgi:hypothetical protein